MFQFKEKNNTIFHKRGYCGVALYQPKTPSNAGLIFRTAAICQADFYALIGARYLSNKSNADTTQSHLHKPIFNFETFEEFKKAIPSNCSLVAIEMAQKARYYHEYTHLDREILMLGSEDHGIPEHILKECKHIIKLPGEVSLNMAVAGSAVLLHRYSQRKEYLLSSEDGEF